MKIYTGRGDYGNTNLIGKSTVRKTDLRVAAYGEIDELNSHIGLLLAHMDQVDGVNVYAPIADVKNTLKRVQSHLFDIGTILSDINNQMEMDFPESRVEMLESAIDDCTVFLPELKYFIMPGGSLAASQAHVTRTVSRRVERSVWKFAEDNEVPNEVLIYLNRLSDLFFTVARALNNHSGIEETFYKNTGEVFHN